MRFLHALLCVTVSTSVVLFAKVNVPSIENVEKKQGTVSGSMTLLRKTWQQYKKRPIHYTVGFTGVAYGIYRITRYRVGALAPEVVNMPSLSLQPASEVVPGKPYVVSLRENLVIDRTHIDNSEKDKINFSMTRRELPTLKSHLQHCLRLLSPDGAHTSYCDWHGNNLYQTGKGGTISVITGLVFAFVSSKIDTRDTTKAPYILIRLIR